MFPNISPGLVGNAVRTAGSALSSAVPAVAGAASGNWLMALPALFSLLQNSGLFGGNDEDEQFNELLRMMKPKQNMYQSPFLSKVDPVMFQALMNQMRRSSNWGWPEGMGMDPSFIPQDLSAGGLPGTIRPK